MCIAKPQAVSFIPRLSFLFILNHFQDQLRQAGLFFGELFVLFALLVGGFFVRADRLGQIGRAAIDIFLENF